MEALSPASSDVIADSESPTRTVAVEGHHSSVNAKGDLLPSSAEASTSSLRPEQIEKGSLEIRTSSQNILTPTAEPLVRPKPALKTYGKRIVSNRAEEPFIGDIKSGEDARKGGLPQSGGEVILETDFEPFSSERDRKCERSAQRFSSPAASSSSNGTFSSSLAKDEHATDPTSEEDPMEFEPPKAPGREEAIILESTSSALTSLVTSDLGASIETHSLSGTSTDSEDEKSANENTILPEKFAGRKSIQELMDEVDAADDDDIANLSMAAKLLSSSSSLSSLPATTHPRTQMSEDFSSTNRVEQSSISRAVVPDTESSSPSRQSHSKFDHRVISAKEKSSSPSLVLPREGMEDSSGNLLPSLDEEEDQEESLPIGQSRKNLRRIVTSEDEEDEESRKTVTRQGLGEAATKATSERISMGGPDDSDAEESFSHSENLIHLHNIKQRVEDSRKSDSGYDEPVPTLSKRQKMELLASKRTPIEPKKKVKQISRSREASVASEYFSESSSGEERKGWKKASKPRGGLTKKGQDAMHRETAALQRGQDYKIQPRVKQVLKVLDVMKKINSSTKRMRPITDRLPIPAAIPHSKTVPSSSSVIEDSGDIVEPVTLSEDSAGKQEGSDLSLDHIFASPQARLPTVETFNSRTATAWPFSKAMHLGSDDGEQDLPSVNEMVETSIKEKEAKAYIARKLQAVKAAASKQLSSKAGGTDESDSDLEVEGAPQPRPAKSAKPSYGDTIADPLRTPRLSKTERTIRDLNGPRLILKHDEEPTDSQLDIAAHTFGKNLGQRERQYVPGSAKKSSKLTTASAPIKAVSIDHEQLNMALLHKAKIHNIEITTKKRKMFRAKQMGLPISAPSLADKVQVVDVRNILQRKEEARKLAQLQSPDSEEDEEDDDGDYEADLTDGGSEEALPSDADEGSQDGILPEDDMSSTVDARDSAQSRKENIRPSSSQLTSRKDKESGIRSFSPESEDEMVPGLAARSRRVVRIEDEEDTLIVAADEREGTPPFTGSKLGSLPVEIPSFMQDSPSAGFSQFFGTAFSQDVGVGHQGEGFESRNADNQLPQASLMGPVQIDSVEREMDAELLGARNAFNALDPVTPKEHPAPRQYVNKQGFLTQTRPADLWQDSPGDTQPFSAFRQRASDSKSQPLTQTQLYTAPTPTQPFRDTNGLHQTSAMIGFDSFVETDSTATEPAPTEIATEDQEEDTQGMLFPSAAQPIQPKDAFVLLKAAAARFHPKEQTEKKRKSAFIDTEADLSEDEEMGMLGLSGDEDEAGHDAELESLVDNEEVDFDIEEVQDKLAAERYAEDVALADAKNEAQMKRIAEGKERMKRKNGGLDLDDDDFDDDDYGMSKRRLDKRPRVENLTIAALKESEETQAFAEHFTEGLIVPPKEGELSFLEIEYDSSDDPEGDNNDDEEERWGPSLPKISGRDAEILALELARRRRERQDEVDAPPEIRIGNSSSPIAGFKLKVRTFASIAFPLRKEEETFDDSQYSLRPNQSSEVFLTKVRLDSKEDSQGSGNGTTAGSRSAVTSFKRETKNAKAAMGGTLAGGKHGKTEIEPRASRLGSFRKNKFA